MANEISLNNQLIETRSGVTINGQCSIAITKVGTESIGNFQIVTTSSAQLTFGSVTTIGYLFVKNIDATNFVSVSSINPAVAGTSQITLKPGEACCLPTRIASWYSIADTASCTCFVAALEL